jgi:hypothetical protein
VATATKKTESVPVTTYKEETTGVTLTLNNDEAQVLADILGFISGSGITRRKHTSEIMLALVAAGFHFRNSPEAKKTSFGGYLGMRDIEGNLFFK